MDETQKDILLFDRYYTENETVRQTYDLAVPAGAKGKTGLVLCVHGGGWIEGDKAPYRPAIVEACEKYNLAAAALNYRYVSKDVGFDEQLDDISAALAAIKKTGQAVDVDFDRVLLTGISAGGHLSLLYAYTRKQSAPVRPVCVTELCGPADLADGFYVDETPDLPRIVDGGYFRMVLGFGVKQTIAPDGLEDARAALAKYSPVNYVTGAVPTFFGHGDRDAVVPFRGAKALEASLEAAGAEHEFVPFPGAGHECDHPAAMKRMMELFFRAAETYLR
ncbi:MAG: alpha/beta hydrolase [Clostridia bacterium]|nr:alpha/beta hydrolase [Clostridia bacterium]